VSLSGLERKLGRRNGIHNAYMNFTDWRRPVTKHARAFLGETFSDVKANTGAAACMTATLFSSFLLPRAPRSKSLPAAIVRSKGKKIQAS
jgi:hypothetical protein